MDYINNFEDHRMAKEFTSFVTPDTLRQYLQIQKKFYNLHTKNNNGHIDMNNSQYAGVIENMGNSILAESRKLLLDKPSLSNLIISNDFSYYFNFQHTDCVDNYNLQTLLEATLKENVFLSNKTYRIRFSDYSEHKKVILRSDSTSDDDVRRFILIDTKTAPTLIITESDGTETEILLTVQDHSYSIAKAFVLFKKDNPQYPSESEETYRIRFNALLSKYLPQTEAEIHYYFYIMDSDTGCTNEDVIEYVDDDNKILLTKPLTNELKNRPLIWFNTTTHNMLPDLEPNNNTDLLGLNIFEVGTNGHHQNFLYPITYDINNIPGLNMDNIDEWYIKAIPDRLKFIDDTMENEDKDHNFRVPVNKLVLMHTTKIGVQPITEHEIYFNGDFKNITLCEDLSWLFIKPSEGDYDYESYENETEDGYDPNVTSAYVQLNKFICNIMSETSKRDPLKPALKLTFNHKFLYDKEILSGNAVSGIHIGMSADSTGNSVIRRNGITHNLGEFDGLPDYFKILLPDKITEKSPNVPDYEILKHNGIPIEQSLYRAYVEAFAIRDVATDDNQSIMDKQVAALLLDGGIPLTLIPELLKDLNMTIVYVKDWVDESQRVKRPAGLWLGLKTTHFYSWDIIDTGSGYEINDEFEFKIGTIQVHGRITDIIDGEYYFSLTFIPNHGYVLTSEIQEKVTVWETNSEFKYRCPVCRVDDINDNLENMILGNENVDDLLLYKNQISEEKDEDSGYVMNKTGRVIQKEHESSPDTFKLGYMTDKNHYDGNLYLTYSDEDGIHHITHCPDCGAALTRTRGTGLRIQLTITDFLWDILTGDGEYFDAIYPARLYNTVARSESSNNWLSEINWMGRTSDDEREVIYNLGNCNIENQEDLPKFYFHSRRTFSTQPFIESRDMLVSARVFNISNDPSVYINNDVTNHQDKKPNRTMARICDIPVSWMQLIGIKKSFPPIIIDIYYIRQEASYTRELQEMVWNTLNRRWVWNADSNNNVIIPRVFSKDSDLDSEMTKSFLEKFYGRRINMNMSINLLDEDITFEVYLHGTGYETGDIFRFFIGGNTVSGIVKLVSSTGEVIEIEILRDDLSFNINTIFDKSVLETTSSTGDGNGLSILMTVDSTKWDQLQPRNFGIFNDIFTFRFDKRDNLWIWEYDRVKNEWFSSLRITGDELDQNDYDSDSDYFRRTIRSTFIHNILNVNNGLSRIGDSSLQLDGLKLRWSFVEIGFDRKVPINEDIYFQYRNNTLISNESSNPKHYMIKPHVTNPNINWWQEHAPVYKSDDNLLSKWSFTFKIGNVELLYTFSDEKGVDNLQTTHIRVMTPFDTPNEVDGDLFKKSETILVNSYRTDNGRTGPRMVITLSEDFYTWLFASMCFFNLDNVERGAFSVDADITEPTTFKFIIKSETTTHQYPIIVRYMLDDNHNLIGPFYTLETDSDFEEIVNTEEGRASLRGTSFYQTVVFNAIKRGDRIVYQTEVLPDEWNEHEPPEGWGAGPNVHLNIDQHHYDRIIPQVRHTKRTRMTSTVKSDIDINTRDDHSLEIKNINKQNCLYFLIQGRPNQDEFHDVMMYEFFTYSNKNTWGWADPGLHLLPQSHKLNLPEYYNRTNMLVYTTFNPHDNNEPYSHNIQPLMSVWSPTKSTVKYQNRISTDTTYITDQDEITFANTVDQQLGVLNLNLEDIKYSGRLMTNCYTYDESEELMERQQLRLTLQSMSRGNVIFPEEQICPVSNEYAQNCMCEECSELSETYGYSGDGLLAYILTNFGSEAHPIRSEGTSYAYSHEMLVDYIMSNTVSDPSYKKDDIRLLRKRCERVVGYNYDTDKWQGIGKQPKGGYDVINVTEYDPKVIVRSDDHIIEAYNTADIAYVFNFTTFPSREMLNSFRMFANDFDISKQTLLIYKTNMWVWWNDGWRSIFFESDQDPIVDDCDD